MNQLDPNFDWVSARAKCSPDSVIEILKQQIESDVEKRNTLLSATELQYDIKFVMAIGSGAFRVSRTRMGEMLEYATFSRANDGVKVIYSSAMNISPIETRLTLSDDQECKLRAGERELSFWQFRKLSLEPILFSPEMVGW